MAAVPPPVLDIRLVAGAANKGFVDGPALQAEFNDSLHVAVSDGGSQLYVADMGNSAIRRLDLQTAMVSTVASVPLPRGVAIAGNQLYVTTFNNEGNHDTAWSDLNEDKPELACWPRCHDGPDSLKILNLSGDEIQSIGGFFSPGQVQVAPDGKAWVLDEVHKYGWSPRLSVIEGGERHTRHIFGEWGS